MTPNDRTRTPSNYERCIARENNFLDSLHLLAFVTHQMVLSGDIDPLRLSNRLNFDVGLRKLSYRKPVFVFIERSGDHDRGASNSFRNETLPTLLWRYTP